MQSKEVVIACQGAMAMPYQQLIPFQGGLKTLTDENYARLKKQIVDLGFSEPIAVWQSPDGQHFILNGHQRLTTVRRMVEQDGYVVGPLPIAIVKAASHQEAKRKVLAMASTYGLMTEHSLADYMVENQITLDDLQINFDFPSINLDVLDGVIEHGEKPDNSENDDVIPDEVPATCQLGDLWLLGEHRLLCGDSTNKQQIELLMGGKKANLWITDPPYGVSYADKNEFLNSLGKPNSVTKRIENDHLSLEEMEAFWFESACNAYFACTDQAPYYWFACQGGDQMMMMMMSLSRANWKVRHELIWVKNNHVLGRCDYQYKHEPILYGWKKDGTHKFYGGFQTSVLEFAKPQSSKLHPTMKPIELIERLLENSSETKDSILDTFLGAGSTLIACEKTNRRCFGMEIDPQYCDVILKRWENYTGKKAVKHQENLA